MSEYVAQLISAKAEFLFFFFLIGRQASQSVTLVLSLSVLALEKKNATAVTPQHRSVQ